MGIYLTMVLENLSNRFYTNIVYALKIIPFVYNYLLFPFCYTIFDPYKIFFFTICVLLYIIMYTLNFIKAITKMNAIKIRDIFYENYYKRIGFSKEESYWSF